MAAHAAIPNDGRALPANPAGEAYIGSRGLLLSMVRLFVGGLAENVTPTELGGRFQPFGRVDNCIVVAPKDNDTIKNPRSTCRGFGFLDLEPANDAALRKCLGVVRYQWQF